MTVEFLIPLLAATVQSGTPILYATLGEIITEKSGILNLGVEGMMMVGALAASALVMQLIRAEDTTVRLGAMVSTIWLMGLPSKVSPAFGHIGISFAS